MKKSILFCFFLSAVLLCACGGDELHYLDTTTAATAETAATAAPFPYTPSEDGVLSYNPLELIRLGTGLQYHDGYLYFLIGGSAKNKWLVRMNVETGNVTDACPDPLCRTSSQSREYLARHRQLHAHPPRSRIGQSSRSFCPPPRISRRVCRL